MIKVSVVIPIYNIKEYIDKQVSCIKAQTMPEWELILVDDGSTDGIKERLEQYAQEDQRIKYICHDKNAGVAEARATGWSNAKGEYICFFDGDDWVEPYTLEKLYQSAKQNNADIVCFSYHIEDNRRDKIFHFEEKKDIIYTGAEALNELHRRKNIQPHAWNKLYKRDIFEARMFPSQKLLGEDYGMLVDLFEKTSRILQINQPYYHYVLRKGSTLDSGYCDFYKNGFYFYEKYENDLIMKYPQFYKNIRRYHLIEQMAIVVSMIKNEVYDHEMRRKITVHVRKNLGLLLFSRDVALKFKVGALALSIHYNILKYGYRLVYYRTGKQRKECS